MNQIWIGGRQVGIGRAKAGVVRIEAEDEAGFAAALGYAHAMDRPLQLWLTRLIGQGRLAECLKDDPATIAIDIVMRKIGFWHASREEAAALAPDLRLVLDAYAQGVMAGLVEFGVPWELKLAKYRPEPWTASDSVMIGMLMGYIGLAQTQQDIEKLILQSLQGGVDLAKLKALFAPHLDDLDETRLEAIKKVKIAEPIAPAGLALFPALRASNNWAIAPRRSASGKAIYCSDPHLEVNRLPAIWAEVVARVGEDRRVGITVPGAPGLVMGRTSRIAYGLTYGFMDQIDYVIEEVKGGACRRGDAFEPVATRIERIRRKGGGVLDIEVHASRNGVLEHGDGPLVDGFYLARAWIGAGGGAGQATFAALTEATRARNVDEARKALAQASFSANWIVADADGRIAYQQSGWAPRRRVSGLVPRLGWDAADDWRGRLDPSELLSIVDPAEGFLATANDPVGKPGVNLAMGTARLDRIKALLAGRETLAPEDMKRVQSDLTSLQAEAWLAHFLPLLPDGPAKATLAAWDRCYDPASKGAVLFERFYEALLEETMGRRVFGLEPWRALWRETCLPHTYFDLFDRALMSDEALWYAPEGKAALVAKAAARAFDGIDPAHMPDWGALRQFKFTNVFFNGLLPGFAGFDRGPYPLPGGRATIAQGQLFKSYGRDTSFAPSWRFIADLGSDVVETALPGGPSDRRFSEHYATDLARWLGFAYKRLPLL
jgi:penicillin amidase